MEQVIITLGTIAKGLFPLAFVAFLLYFFALIIVRNRKLARKVANEFPEIENPSSHVEAAIRGLQKSKRKI